MSVKRIGIVLNEYPVASETFIDTFLNHLSHYKIIIFANSKIKKTINRKIVIKPYMSSWPYRVQLLTWLASVFLIPLYLRRFLRLLNKGVPMKQLIADANILTIQSLDLLHFPFANNAIGREYYAEELGARMTLSFRGSDINVFPIYRQQSYERIWPYVHKVHCNSVELAVKLKSHRIPPNIPIEVIPPALRSDLQNCVPKSKTIQQPGSIDNPLIIVTLGRLHWIKDYPLALRTISEIKKRGINVKYYILGKGSELEQLMFLRHELDLAENIQFVMEIVPEVIVHYFNRAHIYLQTSLAEGFSNACIEAQAFGLPCIVPEISGMSMCIEDGKTGIIVKERTEKNFAEAIVQQLENIKYFDHHRTSHRSKNNFSLEQQHERWLRFFTDLFQNKHSNK